MPKTCSFRWSSTLAALPRILYCNYLLLAWSKQSRPITTVIVKQWSVYLTIIWLPHDHFNSGRRWKTSQSRMFITRATRKRAQILREEILLNDNRAMHWVRSVNKFVTNRWATSEIGWQFTSDPLGAPSTSPCKGSSLGLPCPSQFLWIAFQSCCRPPEAVVDNNTITSAKSQTYRCFRIFRRIRNSI